MTLADKPRCFGLPSMHHQESKHCGACPHRADCEQDSYNRLIALRNAGVEVGDDVIARYQSRGSPAMRPASRPVEIKLTRETAPRTIKAERIATKLTERDEELLLAVPDRVRQMVRLMMQGNRDLIARTALADGFNPFAAAKRQRYMRTACDALLSGGFTRKSLRERFMSEFSWAESTAFSQVSIVVSVFLLLKFVQQDNDLFRLHPSIKQGAR